MVPAPHVSVSPYPCSTGQRKQIFMNLCVFSDRGAPPLSIILILPPSTVDTLEKMYLCKEYGEYFNKYHSILACILKTIHKSLHKLSPTVIKSWFIQVHCQCFTWREWLTCPTVVCGIPFLFLISCIHRPTQTKPCWMTLPCSLSPKLLYTVCP